MDRSEPDLYQWLCFYLQDMSQDMSDREEPSPKLLALSY